MTIRQPYFKSFLLLTCVVIGIHFQANGQDKVQQKVPEKTRILFVLDGSGSMNAKWGGYPSRMSVAKKILTRLVDSLRVNPDVELALRIYGHRFSREANNCTDSKLEVPFSPRNHNAIIEKIQDIKPKGVTPITYSLEQAANDFPPGPGYRNILILITDGIESCGGDPCAASLALQRKGVFLKPFVIGLGIEEGKGLDCVGKFVDSENAKTFNRTLNEAIETTFAKTTVSVELLDHEDKPTVTNIDVTFINTATQAAAYEFVHYLDPSGRPDTVQIDPVLSYDIVVNTVPPMRKFNAEIVNGRHNVIRIPVKLGNLTMLPEGQGNPFQAVLRQKGKGEIIDVPRSGVTYRYLAGEYELETLTFPRRIFSITIEPGKTTTIRLPATGLVNVNSISPGYGSLFEMMDDGSSKWVCHLEENKSLHTYNLLPGRYKIAFRVKQAKGSKYTAVKTFEVQSGKTINVRLFD